MYIYYLHYICNHYLNRNAMDQHSKVFQRNLWLCKVFKYLCPTTSCMLHSTDQLKIYTIPSTRTKHTRDKIIWVFYQVLSLMLIMSIRLLCWETLLYHLNDVIWNRYLASFPKYRTRKCHNSGESRPYIRSYRSVHTASLTCVASCLQMLQVIYVYNSLAKILHVASIWRTTC